MELRTWQEGGSSQRSASDAQLRTRDASMADTHDPVDGYMIFRYPGDDDYDGRARANVFMGSEDSVLYVFASIFLLDFS
jgi:hypothetical protein